MRYYERFALAMMVLSLYSEPVGEKAELGKFLFLITNAFVFIFLREISKD